MSDTNGTQTWRDTLPDDLKTNPSLATVPDVPTLAKNYINQAQLIGAKRTELPNDKWTDKEYGSFWSQLGRPESPDKYTMPKVELPKELPLDETQLKSRRELFHKSGLTDKQAQAVLEADLTWIKSAFDKETSDRAQAKAAGEAELKKEFGDKFEGKMGLLRGVLQNYGNDKVIEAFESAGLSNDPNAVRMLVKIGEALLEDKSHVHSMQNLDPITGAQAEIKSLTLDKDFMEALNTNFHPGHDAALSKWTMLHRQAYPGKTTV